MNRLREVTEMLGVEREGVLRGARFAVCVLSMATAAACSDPAKSSDGAGASSQELGTIICGTSPDVDALGNPWQRPEYYIVSAMNRKLRSFPEFASAIGMQSVKNCDEARAFTTAYTQYFESHPYFDKGMRIDLSQVKVPNLPESAVVRKVLNGTPGMNPASTSPFPVVLIHHHFFKGAKYANGDFVTPQGATETDSICSGTFIAKNFILTAAHCFQNAVLTHPTGLDPTSSWITEDDWGIEWPDSTGNIQINGGTAMALETVKAVTVVEPSWTGPGIMASAPQDAMPTVTLPFYYDVGLLFISSSNDRALPGDADKSTWNVQFEPADSIFSNWSVTDYGYGPTDEMGHNQFKLNSAAPVIGQTLGTAADPAPVAVSGNSVFFTKFQNTGDRALCLGDSGGPMVRQAAAPSTDMVIVAVNSSFAGQNIQNQHCGSAAGNTSYYARADTSVDFIRDIVSSWGPSLPSHMLFDEPGHTSSYMKLHGPSCSSDCECGKEFCYNPIQAAGSLTSSCGECSDCSCVKGQCLPRPGVAADAAVEASCGP